GAPVNRRANGGEAELQPGALHGCPVGFDGFFRRLDIRLVSLHAFGERVGVGANLIVLIARDDAVLDQVGGALSLRRGGPWLRLVAGEISLRLFLLGRGFGHIGLRLRQSGLERARVYREESFALFTNWPSVK